MKRFFITILNIIAIIPVAIIVMTAPIVFIMTFDSPVSGDSTQMWIIRILMYVVIPFAVAGCIFLSQWKRSIVWALIAASPMLYVSYGYFLKTDTFLVEYQTSSQDFICDRGFLSLKEPWFGTPILEMRWIDWHQKRGLNSAQSDAVGALYKWYFIPREELGYIRAKKFIKSTFSENKGIIEQCKNTNNKTLFEVYPLGDKNVIQELDEKISNRNKNIPL